MSLGINQPTFKIMSQKEKYLHYENNKFFKQMKSKTLHIKTGRILLKQCLGEP